MNTTVNQSLCGSITIPADGRLPASGAALEALARRGRCLRSSAMFEAAHTFAGQLRRGLDNVLDRLHRHQIRRKAIADLSRLDDHLLADIGMRREDIPRVVDELTRPSGVDNTVTPAVDGVGKLKVTRMRARTAEAVNDNDCRSEAA